MHPPLARSTAIRSAAAQSMVGGDVEIPMLLQVPLVGRVTRQSSVASVHTEAIDAPKVVDASMPLSPADVSMASVDNAQRRSTDQFNVNVHERAVQRASSSIKSGMLGAQARIHYTHRAQRAVCRPTAGDTICRRYLRLSAVSRG
jgi:hypothetical protein